MKTQLAEVLSALAELTSKVEEMGADLSICKRVMGNPSSASTAVSVERARSPPKLKIPEPKAFQGKREVKDIDKFLK